ncbi:MAG: 23S rRNA (guanosine(2251)-2'-O)-methyltransferase RlmB [Bacilli bacterium]|nr:23S rRNA (guanosine(2251)-2'-O)-methyltransferase RlmB [Bacilli bacterium]
MNHNSKTSLNFVYGRLPSLNCLTTSKVKNVFIQNNFSDEKILKVLSQKGITPKRVNLEELNRMSGNGNHQGIIVEVTPHEYSSVEDILKSAKGKKQPLILILDEIEDPQNFGAILRSADAFSVDGVIIKSKNQVPLNWTVAKVSTGAIEYVKVAKVSNLSNVIRTLKDNRFWIYAADGSGSDSYEKMDYSGAVALIVGSEGRGISQLVMKNSDFIIKIPMSGHVNSLNVSVSTGILLSRIRNK